MHVSTLHRIAPGCAGPARAASVDQAATRRTRFETRPHTISRGDTTPRGIRRRGGYDAAGDTTWRGMQVTWTPPAGPTNAPTPTPPPTPPPTAAPTNASASKAQVHHAKP
jgi:hypothetical protein